MKKSTKKNMLKITCKYILLATLAAFTTINVIKFKQTRQHIEDINPALDSNSLKESAADLETKIQSKIRDYNSKQARIIESYRVKIHKTVEHNFAQAKLGAEKFSENLGSFTYLAKLSGYYALDIVNGDNSAEKEIRAQTSEFVIKYVNQALKETEELSTSCYQELAQNHTILKLEIENLTKASPAFKSIKTRMETLDKTLGKIESKTMIQAQTFSVSLIIEGVLARGTCKAMRNLLKPVITKMGVSVGAAAADGPLPVGDIISIACTAWILYDLYDIKFVAPEKIKRNLLSELNLQKNNFLSEIDKTLDTMAKAFDQ